MEREHILDEGMSDTNSIPGSDWDSTPGDANELRFDVRLAEVWERINYLLIQQSLFEKKLAEERREREAKEAQYEARIAELEAGRGQKETKAARNEPYVSPDTTPQYLRSLTENVDALTLAISAPQATSLPSSNQKIETSLLP